VAKGGHGPSSDVDVVVDLERQDLFFLIGIKQGNWKRRCMLRWMWSVTALP